MHPLGVYPLSQTEVNLFLLMLQGEEYHCVFLVMDLVMKKNPRCIANLFIIIYSGTERNRKQKISGYYISHTFNTHLFKITNEMTSVTNN